MLFLCLHLHSRFFWAILITYIIAFGTLTAGSLGLITDNNQDWWRVRILGIGGGIVLLLSLPGRWNGTNILLLSLMILFLELSIRKSIRTSKEIVSPKRCLIMRVEGDMLRTSIVHVMVLHFRSIRPQKHRIVALSGIVR